MRGWDRMWQRESGRYVWLVVAPRLVGDRAGRGCVQGAYRGQPAPAVRGAHWLLDVEAPC